MLRPLWVLNDIIFPLIAHMFPFIQKWTFLVGRLLMHRPTPARGLDDTALSNQSCCIQGRSCYEVLGRCKLQTPFNLSQNLLVKHGQLLDTPREGLADLPLVSTKANYPSIWLGLCRDKRLFSEVLSK